MELSVDDFPLKAESQRTMPLSPEIASAHASVQAAGGWLDVTVDGAWRIAEPRPDWAKLVGGQKPAGVRLLWGRVEAWDSGLLLFFVEVGRWCAAAGIPCNDEALPAQVRTLFAQLAASNAAAAPRDRQVDFLACVGLATWQVGKNARDILRFVGECVLGMVELIRRPAKFRWRDCLDQMQQCGAMALPIVSLISFLIGLTLAYQASEELRRFGGDIYVADLVGLSMVREMGPMMAAVILAGRTGAAFAATLGNMQANEEIDALRTLGISPVNFLVLPRILALGLMTPLLVLYANAVGIVGGMLVARGILQIPPSAYWIEMQSMVGLTDINAGLIKAVTFGLLIGLSGCLRGLQAERSAAGVGRAATSAVVTAVLLLVVADALFAVLFNILKI
jgi:phospholipid/cholesterol/gamma-HCH transport system permease protein